MVQAEPQVTGVVCKFSVGKVADLHDRDGKVYQQEIELYAVYDNDATSENGRFWTSTPSGRLLLQINNSDTFGFFCPGDEMYLTLRKAG
jgi:hypothetical protein